MPAYEDPSVADDFTGEEPPQEPPAPGKPRPGKRAADKGTPGKPEGLRKVDAAFYLVGGECVLAGLGLILLGVRFLGGAASALLVLPVLLVFGGAFALGRAIRKFDRILNGNEAVRWPRATSWAARSHACLPSTVAESSALMGWGKNRALAALGGTLALDLALLLLILVVR